MDLLGYGDFSRTFRFVYEKAVLNVGRVYDWLGQRMRLDRAYYPILAFILIIPVGIFLPQILGGGNQVVLSLTKQDFSFQVLLAYFFYSFCLEHD